MTSRDVDAVMKFADYARRKRDAPAASCAAAACDLGIDKIPELSRVIVHEAAERGDAIAWALQRFVESGSDDFKTLRAALSDESVADALRNGDVDIVEKVVRRIGAEVPRARLILRPATEVVMSAFRILVALRDSHWST